MALTRRMLKGMGLTEEQQDSIIDAHAETVDGLKSQIEALRADTATLQAVQQELDGIKNGTDWKAKYEEEHKAFTEYQAAVTGKEALTAKQAAYRKLLAEENIPAKFHDRIIKMTDFDSMELDGDGIKDAEQARAGIQTEWGDYVATAETRSAQVDTPPSSSKQSITRADIYKKDEYGRYVMSTAERQKALTEHPELMTS